MSRIVSVKVKVLLVSPGAKVRLALEEFRPPFQV